MRANSPKSTPKTLRPKTLPAEDLKTGSKPTKSSLFGQIQEIHHGKKRIEEKVKK